MPKQVHPHPPDTMFINSSLSSLRWLKIHRSSQKHRFERIGCSGPKSCESSVAMKITDIASFLVWATTLDCDRGGKTGSLKEKDLMPQRVKLTLQICEDWQDWGVNRQQGCFSVRNETENFAKLDMSCPFLQTTGWPMTFQEITFKTFKQNNRWIRVHRGQCLGQCIAAKNRTMIQWCTMFINV